MSPGGGHSIDCSSILYENTHARGGVTIGSFMSSPIRCNEDGAVAWN